MSHHAADSFDSVAAYLSFKKSDGPDLTAIIFNQKMSPKSFHDDQSRIAKIILEPCHVSFPSLFIKEAKISWQEFFT